MVQNTRDQRIQVGKLYVEEKPDAVITWGFNNPHPDHRYTGFLALDGIKMARINKIMETDTPHRKNIKLLSYFEKGNGFPIKYVNLNKDSMEKAKEAAHYYGDIYGQHIQSDGTLSWDPSGIPLTNVPGNLMRIINEDSGDYLNISWGKNKLKFI